MKIGENIKKIRKEKKISQKQLGVLCGMSESQIGAYENGYRSPKFETVLKIANALEVSVNEFGEDYKILVQSSYPLKLETSFYVDIWAFYYSGVFDTYKQNIDLFYTWYRKKKQKVSNQLELLKSIQFDFNIPFHSYKEDIDNSQRDGFEDHIRYLEELIKELDYLFNTLEQMYEDENSFKDDGIILDTTDKKRKILLSMIHTSSKEQKEIEQARYNSMSNEEIEKEFNSFVEKLKLENEKLLKELNKIQDNNK